MILNDSEVLCWIGVNLIGCLIICANFIPFLLIHFIVTLEVFFKVVIAGILDDFGVFGGCLMLI